MVPACHVDSFPWSQLSFILIGTTPPLNWMTIWVTPFLRPETVLLGVLLAMGSFDRLTVPIVTAIGMAALALFSLLPNLFTVNLGTMVMYPALGVLCASITWLALHAHPVRSFLANPVLVFLGKISFGLYVFHVLGIWLASHVFTGYFLRGCLAALLTVVMASASYFWFERRFLLMKQRYTTIATRTV